MPGDVINLPVFCGSFGSACPKRKSQQIFNFLQYWRH